jgi:hypothetical protein
VGIAALCAALMAFALAGCGSDSSSTTGGDATTEASSEKKGEVRVEWEEPRTEEDQLGYELLEAGETEEIITGLAETFELPNRLVVQGINGIEGGPAYYPEDNTIVLPYQFATMVLGVMAEGSPEASEEEIGEQAGSVNTFILAHEFAHAMIENLEIPIFGREEDAADSISTALLLEVPNGDEYAANAALFWAELASEGGHSLEEYADEHSLNIQRALNILCWVAGSSEQAYEEVAESEALPEERLERCPEEYEQVVGSMEQELEPHLEGDGEESASE